ncbi:MAG: hypothetical protein WD005_04925, partial [Haliea sp.]
RQTDMYADDSAAPAIEGSRLFHRIWFKLIGQDAFRPYGSPTRFQFIKNKFREKITGNKVFLYCRATLLALKGDTVARQHFTNRLNGVRRSARSLAARSASVSAAFLVAFLLVNFVAYSLIQYGFMDHPNDSDSDRIQAESVLLRMASEQLTQEQRDVVDNIVPDASKGISFIIGDTGTGRSRTKIYGDNTSIPGGVGRDSGNTYFALDAIDDRITLQQQSLLAALENGLRPKEVIFVFRLDETADAIFRILRKNNGISEWSWAAPVLEFLPLVHFAGKRYFHRRYETDSHPGYHDYPIDEGILLQGLDVSALAESYRSRLRFFEQLSTGFGFKVRAYYLPSGLIDPRNHRMPPSFRESRLRQYLTGLHERIRKDISNGTIRMKDMSQVFADMKSASYLADGSFSPEGIRRIAELIAAENHPAQ